MAEESPPFSRRSAPAFYISLLRRYWKPLVAVLVLMGLFSGLSYLRVGAAGLLVDSVKVEETRALQGGGEKAVGGNRNLVDKFEAIWKKIVPADYPPFTEKLGAPGGFIRFLTALVIILAVVSIVLAVTYYFKEYLGQRMIVSMLVDVRRALFNHLTYHSVSYFHEQRCGDLISRATNDVNVIQNSLRKICEILLQQPLMIVMGLTCAYVAHPTLFWISLPIYALIMIPVVLAGRKVIKHGRRRLEKMSLITEALEQLFSGIRIVKSFGMERHERESFGKKNRAFARSFLKMRRARIMGRSLQEMLFNLALAGLFLLGGLLLTIQTGMGASMGEFGVFFVALLQVYNPVRTFSKAWNEIQEARPGIERVLEILRERSAIRDRPGAREFPGLGEKIAFAGVGFSYTEVPGFEATGLKASSSLPALQDIDLEVRAGEMVALVGPSGAGKSTLVDLLARFYDPQKGRITIDGVDIREYRYASYLEAIAIVSQEPFLFNTTIHENIRYGREGASAAEIEEAAKVANAHDFILEQPEGYDTEIGDRGAKLSGGQRQRLTIARAVLKNAPILILDEATSALDSEAEREVQKAIDNLVRQRTTFVIAHRLSTITGADKIVVLDSGRIVEVGSHEDLLGRRGRYYELCTSQSAAVKPGRKRRRKRRRKLVRSRAKASGPEGDEPDTSP